MSKKIAIANISKVLKLLKCEYPLICFSLLHDLINHSCLSYRFEFRGLTSNSFAFEKYLVWWLAY